MAEYLVIKGARARVPTVGQAIPPFVNMEPGRVISDSEFDVAMLAEQGVALVVYNPVTMDGPIQAFRRQSGRPNNEADLLALLLAAQAIGGSGSGGQLVSTRSSNLSFDFSTTAQPPVYTTVHTLPLTTVLVSSYLAILWTGTALMSGASLANLAPTFRFRLNGVAITPGGGTTVNMDRSRIMPLSYSRRMVVSAGVQTVIVEAAYFGPAGQTLAISPVALSDLMHSHLTLQEQIT